MITFGFFTDAGLTAPLASSLIVNQAADGSTGPVTFQLWLGSNSPSKKLQSDISPGVNQITISVVDNAPGSGHPASEVKLALTEGGLATAIGGDPLDLGVEVLSGVVNAVEVWVRVQDSTSTVGTSTELSLVTNNVRESAA